MSGTLINDAALLRMIKSLGGVSSTYTPSGGAASTVWVIFDSAYIEAQMQEALAPTAHGRESDFTGTINGGTLVVSGTTYRIKNHQPDGAGCLDLILEATA